QNGFRINCYPSIDYVAWKSDYSPRQVKRALHDLEAPPNIIVPTGIHPVRGTTEYEIHLERAPKKPPFQPKVRRQGGGRNSLRVLIPGKKRGDMVSPLHVTKSHPLEGQNVTPKQDVVSPQSVSAS